MTQVVEPAELECVGLTRPAIERAIGAETEDLRVQEIIRTLMPTVSARLREISQSMLDERLHHLEANMLVELESMVRRAMKGCEVSQDTGRVEVADLKM